MLFVTWILIFFYAPVLNGGYNYPYSHPWENFTTKEFIINAGYSYEEYFMESPDGVISLLQRIPHGSSQSFKRTGIPVLMFHGLLTTAKMWVAKDRKANLAFNLVEAGYDVWLANARGCSANNELNKKFLDNPIYWDFSFQEMALTDLPLTINFILNKTGHTKLFYVGMSMGTTVGFILLSTKTEFNRKVHAMIAFSPIAYMKYSNIFSSLLTFVASLGQRYFGNSGSLPETFTYQLITEMLNLCKKWRIYGFCVDLILGFFGDQVTAAEKDWIPVLFKVFPDITSLKTMSHFWQLIKSGEFRMYDYGIPGANLKIYNQTTPPEFNLSKIITPVALFATMYDTLGDPKDAETLSTKLGNLKFNSPLFFADGCGHLCSVGALSLTKAINPKIINFMKTIVLFPEN